MFEHQEQVTPPVGEAVPQQDTTAGVETGPTAAPTPVEPESNGAPAESAPDVEKSVDGEGWHAEAGRKGAERVRQLIEEGKLYEKEHGLKRGRQRIRQLIELGKRYEQEHELRQRATGKRRERLARGQRKELVVTLLRCLIRLSKPSFRADLGRLVQELQNKEDRAA